MIRQKGPPSCNLVVGGLTSKRRTSPLYSLTSKPSDQSTLLAAMYRLIALMLAILAAAVSAYNAPVTAGRPAIQPRMTTVSPVAFAEEFDIGLDNLSIPEDKDAAPARKCASCFG